MKKVLVTGATGALGRAVVARLRKDGHWRVLAALRDCRDVNCIQLDVRERGQIVDVIKRNEPEWVLHLASTYANDFDDAYSINVGAARHLLEAVQQFGFRTRVLLIGSAAEYGAVRPEENPIGEEHVLNPVSVYGLTKAWQTQLAGIYANRGVDVLVARVFNLDGPDMSERLFVGRLQRQIDDVLAGRKSAIEVGPLAATRDYVSTDEAAAQVLAIASHGETGHVYHVASGKPVIMRDILMRSLALNNLDASIVQEAADLTNRIGYDVPEIYADMSKTMRMMQRSTSGVANDPVRMFP